MQIEFEIDLPSQLGHSCFVVLWLLSMARAQGIDPVTRLWLLEHMERRTSPNTATAALRYLTNRQYILRVTGGWRINADQALQLPLSVETQKRAERAFGELSTGPAESKSAQSALLGSSRIQLLEPSISEDESLPLEHVVVVNTLSIKNNNNMDEKNQKRAERAFGDMDDLQGTIAENYRACVEGGIVGPNQKLIAEDPFNTPARIRAASIYAQNANVENPSGLAVALLKQHTDLPDEVHRIEGTIEAKIRKARESGFVIHDGSDEDDEEPT